jgi:ribosomal protein S18 acetylase RimI-like enzyme
MSVPLLTDGMRARLEACTSAFHTRWLELLADHPGNPSAVEIRRFGDDVVATAASNCPDTQWMQHVTGLSPARADLVPAVAAWYHSKTLRPRFEIAPALGFEPLAAALAAAGARQSGFIDVLWSRPAAHEDAPSDVEVRAIEPGGENAQVFARVLLGGHEVPDDASPEHWAAVARWAAEPEWWCYLAEVDGEPVGAAALIVTDGIGYLANAATLPAGRQRGCQQALIQRRMHDAAEAECKLFVTMANPGSVSHRNLERAGLGVAYTKVVWTVTP